MVLPEEEVVALTQWGASVCGASSAGRRCKEQP